MADETISEKCENLYNKLNTFVESEISRDITPQINNLNSRINALEPNLVRVKEVNGNASSVSAGGTSTQTFTVPACPSGYNWEYFSTSTGWGTVSNVELSGTTLTVTLLNVSNTSHDISFSGVLMYYPKTIEAEPHISVTATNPYLLEGEVTDLVVSLTDEFGLPLNNKNVTIGQSVFIDNGTTASHNDNWTTINSSASLTRLDDYSELKIKEDATSFAWINKNLSVTDGITIEFDLKQATLPSSNKRYFTFRGTNGVIMLGISKSYENLADGQWHHYKFDVNGLTVTPTIDGVQRDNLSLSGNFITVQLEASEEAVHHFKNFVIYNNINGVTDGNGEFALHNVSVTDDTTFTASYNGATSSCDVYYPCLFVDYGTTTSHNDNWDTWSTYTVSRTRSVESTLIEPVDRTTVSYQIKYINNMSSPSIIEFDCCQVGGATNSVIFQLRGNKQSVIRQIALSSYTNLSLGEWYHWKVDLVNGNFTNETTNQTVTFSTEGIISFFFVIQANAQHNLKYKNFVIY